MTPSTSPSPPRRSSSADSGTAGGWLTRPRQKAPKLYTPTADIKALLRDRPETPVVFLDVDGVLHRSHTTDESDIFLAPCVDALARVLRETGARVVLSSSWREFVGMAAKVDDLLTDRGLEPLLAATPSLLVKGRAGEIKAWLKKHCHAGRHPRWVAIDDQHMGLAHFVHTNGAKGMTAADANAAIDILTQTRVGCHKAMPCKYCLLKKGASVGEARTAPTPRISRRRSWFGRAPRSAPARMRSNDKLGSTAPARSQSVPDGPLSRSAGDLRAMDAMNDAVASYASNDPAHPQAGLR